ncbi:serine/threonine-protein kinase [Paraliomyxa miuraensis]|uniref:serine/threonine-protein kinase n=1 Tax=Paraliomyxa miuraensis TaxID=376150 RepID=UPI00225387D6|nr:serine/threonine-protein kinase [Paraliomyxa miuraensis]MCX4245603.1 serine/threonine protein kinase [Paraliomyxa miuraensis]
MDRIGEYLVTRLIGEGGMGKVYEAQERLSKRRVALKVLRPELAKAEDGRRLFLNEMTILAHLDHPNVVRCLACQEVEGELVMALEFLEGPTLREVLVERGRLPWTEAASLVVQIAAGLSAAHRQSPPIVHRDLKPENVIVLQDGRVKVMDFGIAKVLEAMRQGTTHSVGTLQYMSPEQIDAGDVGPRADLYALGLVFYELLAGQPPFSSASPRELLNLHCTEPAPALPDDVRKGLPKGVERLLFQMLEKRAEDRPESAQAVIEALEPFSVAELDLFGAGARSSRTQSASSPSSPSSAPSSIGSSPTGRDTDVPAVVSRPSTPPVAADTIGLIERASGPRQIPAVVALVIIVLLSVAAGVVTYLVRTGSASGAQLDSSAVSAAARPDPAGRR